MDSLAVHRVLSRGPHGFGFHGSGEAWHDQAALRAERHQHLCGIPDGLRLRGNQERGFQSHRARDFRSRPRHAKSRGSDGEAGEIRQARRVLLDRKSQLRASLLLAVMQHAGRPYMRLLLHKNACVSADHFND